MYHSMCFSNKILVKKHFNVEELMNRKTHVRKIQVCHYYTDLNSIKK